MSTRTHRGAAAKVGTGGAHAGPAADGAHAGRAADGAHAAHAGRAADGAHAAHAGRAADGAHAGRAASGDAEGASQRAARDTDGRLEQAAENVPAGRSSQQRIIASDKREAIMQAALDLFVERGFYGVAVPEIADRAQVGAGTIYRHFESKEALVNALYRQEKQRFAQNVVASFPAIERARELFRALWNRMAAYATANHASFVFLELHHHAPYLDVQSRAVEQRMLQLFEGVITAAQGRGELKDAPPRLLMGIVMGAFTGVIRSCVESESSAEGYLSRADWKLAEQCVWEAIRA
jgi:AcrR family transcriptional regulator